MSLWLEDYSGLKLQFDAWRRAGVTSLREYLQEDLARVEDLRRAHPRHQGQRQNAVAVSRPRTSIRLTANLDRVFRDDMLMSHLEELVQLWDGRTEFSSHAVNYTLSGRRLDIQLEGAHPARPRGRLGAGAGGDRRRQRAREARAAASPHSEAYARGLFEHSPVSLWVEDFSASRSCSTTSAHRGIIDFRTFTDVHPEFVTRCMQRNPHHRRQSAHACNCSRRRDKPRLLLRLPEVFRDDDAAAFSRAARSISGTASCSSSGKS